MRSEGPGNAIVAFSDAYNAGPVLNAATRKSLHEGMAVDEAERKLRKHHADEASRSAPCLRPHELPTERHDRRAGSKRRKRA